jgi:hypothetical protein
MEIVEQKYITSLRDIGRLNVIDFNRCNRYWENNFVRALEYIGNCLINTSAYTIVHEDMRAYPDRDDFPDWEHVGKTHRPLGKLYWNMFHALYEGKLIFHDMPDFSGTMFFDSPISQVSFLGDIGRVSASTFGLEVLPNVNRGDLWISVVSYDTHIIIEFLEDIGRFLHAGVSQLLEISLPIST